MNSRGPRGGLVPFIPEQRAHVRVTAVGVGGTDRYRKNIYTCWQYMERNEHIYISI